MKNIILYLILALGIILPGVGQSQAWEIKINPEQDKDSVYIMLSENAVGKYRQGRGKWINYEGWKTDLIDSIRAVISDSIATVGGGGVELPYYEVVARIFHDPIPDTLAIDTILLNTFPGTWSFNPGNTGTVETGFEFNCNDCDGTVTFTNTFPETTNDYGPFGLQNGFTGGNNVPWFLAGGGNNGKSTVWSGVRADGAAFTDAIITDVYQYFLISFRYYHGQ